MECFDFLSMVYVSFFVTGLCFGFYFAGVYVSTKQHRLPNIYRPSGAAK